MNTVLVIDDEADVVSMLSDALLRAGYQPCGALDGEEGLRIVRKGHIDAVLTDIIMPEREGIETIISLKREFPQIPIIAMSGGGRVGSMDYLQTAKRFGADRILAKPFPLVDMLNTVADVLRAKAS